MHQPVYVGDLLEALFNGMESEETFLVNAVGPEAMTQEDMIKFFLNLADKPFKPVTIPHEVSKIIATHCPKGRLAPYSVSLLDHFEENSVILCKKEFETLLRKPLTGIGQIYNNDNLLTFPSSPILEHLVEIIKTISKNERARKDFIRIFIKYGPSIVLQGIKSYLGYQK